MHLSRPWHTGQPFNGNYSPLEVSWPIPAEYQSDESSLKRRGICPNRPSKAVLSGKTEEFFFPSLSGNSTLSPVKSLKLYLEKTRSLQGEESKLFVSFIKPHRVVTSRSIARWLKTTLEEAGIDTSIWGAHSTHGVSVSAASTAGILTGDILNAANWRSESVFQKFYHRKVGQAAFGRAS